MKDGPLNIVCLMRNLLLCTYFLSFIQSTEIATNSASQPSISAWADHPHPVSQQLHHQDSTRETRVCVHIHQRLCSRRFTAGFSSSPKPGNNPNIRSQENRWTKYGTAVHWNTTQQSKGAESNTPSNMNKPQKHCIDWKTLNVKEQTLSASNHMKFRHM